MPQIGSSYIPPSGTLLQPTGHIQQYGQTQQYQNSQQQYSHINRPMGTYNVVPNNHGQMFANQTHLGSQQQMQQPPSQVQQHQYKRNPPNNYQRFPANSSNSGNIAPPINSGSQINSNLGDFPQGPGRSIQYRNHSQIQPPNQPNTNQNLSSNVYNQNTMSQNFSNVNNQHLQHQQPQQSMAPMNIEQYSHDNLIPMPSSSDVNNLISQI